MNALEQKLNRRLSREITPRVISSMHTLLSESIAHVAHDDDDGGRRFPFEYQQEVLTSKYVDEHTDSADDRRRRAIVKWLGVERRNKRTNIRLYETDPEFNLGNRKLVPGWSLLLEAAKQVQRVIGREPPMDLLERGGFSGGASTSRKRTTGVLFSKFVGSLDSTSHAWMVSKDAICAMKTWTDYEPGILSPRLVKGNVLFTVPKTAVIDRVCCKEPDVNIFSQKAVGDFFRSRLLKRARVDLNDQTINRGLAHRGSIDGLIATIDLSSASDSLCTSLVHILLPDAWFKLLDALRCPKTFIDGASHTNEMFSSMGNGFTFELESLVFWALARATCYLSGTKGRISVYGDDIIIPSAISRAFITVLSWVGFTTNVKKTFVRGRFRESCGGHYWGGNDVTPFYLRRPIATISDLILFLNQLRAWIIRVNADELFGAWDNRSNPWVTFWESLASHVPRVLWGGYSLESRTQLVSSNPQRCELIEVSRIWKAYGNDDVQRGHYLSRLCEFSKLDRNLGNLHRDDADQLLFTQTSTHESGLTLNWGSEECSGGLSFGGLRVPTRRFAMRRATAEPAVFGVVRPLFLSEQLVDYRLFAK